MQVFDRSKICERGLSVNSSSVFPSSSPITGVSANEIPFSIQFVQAIYIVDE